MEQALERKLVAILAADVVGYSRLMSLDEAGTLSRLKALRRDHVEPSVERHRGRVVKLMGDGMLVEFGSVVDALACAVEMQKAAREQNNDIPEDSWIVSRIGINLGDVIVDGDDFYGDGVNVAARLQVLSDPGGIAISGFAYDQAHNKLGLAFKSMGEQRLKNIPEPVRVYRVLLGQAPASGQRRRRRWPLLPAAALLVLLVAGSALVLWPRATAFWRAGAPDVMDEADGRPSIAVLPFGDLGDNPEQDYFAEGLTDDLITDLSKVSGLLVIARNSAFAFKDQPLDVREIADRLHVRYVVEGSVRRAGEAVRINVQLIDAETGSNVWAERYDRDYSKIFALQDEVIGRIVEALSVHLTEGEKTRIERLPTRNLEAYDYYSRAEQKVYTVDYSSLGEALTLYQKAISLDPSFAEAYSGYARAMVDVLGYDYQPLMLSAIARQRAYEAAGRALGLNPQSARAYAVLGILQMLDGETAEALASVRTAVALDPNGEEAALNQAIVLTYAGHNEDALADMERVLRLDPVPRPQVLDYYALVLYMNRQYEKALEILGNAPPGKQSDIGLETIAMANARLGRMDQASKAAAEILRRTPAQSIEILRVLYSHHRRPEDLEHRLEALRLAGIPDLPHHFSGRQEDRLLGGDLAALTDGRTWVGHNYEGAPFLMELGKNGEFALSSRDINNSLISGTFTVEHGALCTQTSSALLGRKFCGPVFRNPGGTYEAQNEYIWVDSTSIWRFSVEPKT